MCGRPPGRRHTLSDALAVTGARADAPTPTARRPPGRRGTTSARSTTISKDEARRRSEERDAHTRTHGRGGCRASGERQAPGNAIGIGIIVYAEMCSCRTPELLLAVINVGEDQVIRSTPRRTHVRMEAMSGKLKLELERLSQKPG